MRITGIETLRLDEFAEFTFVRIHTDEQITGLGETCFGPQAVEAYLHESVAARLLGADPLAIEHHAKQLAAFYIGHGGTGVSTRAHSAIDLALWDILGKVSGQPLYQLLGGRFRDDARIYNTCAGYRYGQKEATRRGTSAPASSGSGLLGDEPRGPYEDLEGFLHHADDLASSLLEQGITAMKIWPFDEVAHANEGRSISAEELRRCLQPLEKIRAAVGDEMEIMVELHALWHPLAAARICHALEQFEPFWVEDPIRLDSYEALARLAGSTRVRFALGESVGGQHDYKRLFDSGAADVVMFDFGWGGGVSQARKVASLAEAYDLPIAPHDCVGPVSLATGAHLSVSAPNALIQETVRAYYTDWYGEIVTELPRIAAGRIAPPEGPGLGLELVPGLEDSEDAHVRWSR